MNKSAIYSIIVFMFLVLSTQGFFIEHHLCQNKQEACCTAEHCVSCLGQDNCNLFNKSKDQHHTSCPCFVDYVQIPLFYSEVNSFNFQSIEHNLAWAYLSTEKPKPLEKDLSKNHFLNFDYLHPFADSGGVSTQIWTSTLLC